MQRAGRRGFTLVEMIIALSIMLVAASIFCRMVASTSKLREVNRENAIAADAARVLLEQMRSVAFSEVFALYNDDASDDPSGAGTAPGNGFSVEDLRPLPTSPNGLVGEVILPVQLVEVEEEAGAVKLGGESGPVVVQELWLREDTVDAELGMPRDLNGDNVVDELDHANDYIILPVCIVVRWQGVFGARSMRVVTMLTDFDLSR